MPFTVGNGKYNGISNYTGRSCKAWGVLQQGGHSNEGRLSKFVNKHCMNSLINLPCWGLVSSMISNFQSQFMKEIYVSNVIPNGTFLYESHWRSWECSFFGIMIYKSLFIDLTEYLIVFAMCLKAGGLHSSFPRLKCLHDQIADGVFQGLL